MPRPTRSWSLIARRGRRSTPTSQRPVWSDPDDLSWLPPATIPLWLTVDGGRVVPKATHDTVIGGRMIGRLFTKPFAGTVPISISKSAVYIGQGPGTSVGHALGTGLPGMIDLRRAAATGLAQLGMTAALESIVIGDQHSVWLNVPFLTPSVAGGHSA